MSSETIDPLDLLREYTVIKPGQQNEFKKITLRDNILCFENFEGSTLKLPLDTQTAWRHKKEGFYSLGSLWCCLNHKDLKLGEQMKHAHELGVAVVSKLEQNELIQYFTGVKSESDMIDIQMRTQTLLSKNELKQRAAKGLKTTTSLDPKQVKKRELKLNEKLQARQ